MQKISIRPGGRALLRIRRVRREGDATEISARLGRETVLLRLPWRPRLRRGRRVVISRDKLGRWRVRAAGRVRRIEPKGIRRYAPFLAAPVPAAPRKLEPVRAPADVLLEFADVVHGALRRVADAVGWDDDFEKKSDFQYEVSIGGPSVSSEALADLLERHAARIPPETPHVFGPEGRQGQARVLIAIEWVVLDDEEGEEHGITRSSSRADPSVSLVLSETIRALREHQARGSKFSEYAQALHFLVLPPSAWVKKLAQDRASKRRRERRAEERRARAAARRRLEAEHRAREAERRARAAERRAREAERRARAAARRAREAERRARAAKKGRRR